MQRIIFTSFIVLTFFLSFNIPNSAYSQSEASAVQVEGFMVTGNKAIDTSVILATIDAFLLKKGWAPGMEYTLDELKEVAGRITLLYQRKGYMLAKAYIPVQKSSDGIIAIALIEGSLGSVDITPGSYYSTTYIERWIGHFQGRAVNERELEQALLLMNDTPGLVATAAFKQGSKVGTSDLNVEATDKYPVKIEFEYNNHGNRLVSRDRYSLLFEITDPEFGSTLSLRAISSDSMDNSFYGSVDYQVSINSNGTRLGLRYLDSDYIVGGSLQDLGVEGDSRIGGLYVTHPILRSRNKNATTTIGFDVKDMATYMLGLQVSDDDLSVASIGIDYDSTYNSGKSFLSAAYSHGFDDLFGSLEKNDPMASRSGAGGEFDKLNVEATRVQKVAGNILLIKGMGQYSPDRLVYPEQFSIGGANTVRGHKLSRYIGDYGYTLSAEINSPLPFTNDDLSDVIRLAVFVDHGGVYNNDIEIGESKRNYIASVGFGARLFLFENRVSIKYDRGYPYENGKVGSSQGIDYIQVNAKILTF